jgi:hypothetical protein
LLPSPKESFVETRVYPESSDAYDVINRSRHGVAGELNRTSEVIMKSLVSAVVAAVALSASVGAYAQSTVTRAQLRNELVQLEHAGYTPSQSSPHYPADIQAAQARVHAVDDSGYGAQPAAVVEGGAPAAVKVRPAHDSVYFGH